jgi:hypothetical protein
MGRNDEYLGSDDIGEDFVGEDFVGADEEMLGAVAPRRRALQVGRRAVATKPQLRAAARAPRKLRGYIGVGEVTFNSTNGNTASLVIEPQRGFRAERLVISRRDGSTVTAGTSARVNGIFIGDQPQSPSIEQPAPTEMFAPDATFSGIDFDTCEPGQKIQINLSASAIPTGTEFVKLTLGFYGDLIRN